MFCPPQPWEYIAVKRQYQESGVCPDYGSPLLKPIAAREGDRVELSAAGIAVNGHAIANTAPRLRDSMNRPLDHYPFGTYVVQPGDVWVASSWNYKSFDSRYFGPVRLSAIRHYLRPFAFGGARMNNRCLTLNSSARPLGFCGSFQTGFEPYGSAKRSFAKEKCSRWPLL
jgi:conjugative transfer signal peptidase TraF